jgi:tripartite-type tricarboxylate transporter receptor subunit TctC
VIAGQVPITYTGLAQTMPHVQAGKLKAIAIGGPRRVASAPGIAPVAETYAGFNGTTSWNLLAPAGTPSEIVQKLNAEVNRILRDPQIVNQLESRGLFPLGGSAEQFGARMKTDYEKWGRIIADVGLKAE